MTGVVQIRKILAIAIVGAALILTWVFLKPHTGIVYKLESTPEFTKIATVSDVALSKMDDAISEFAKANGFQLSLRRGFNKHELSAELSRPDVRLVVRNPFPDPHEVHMGAYRVPELQMAKQEMETLLNRLECKVLETCK